jgi:hypothetical protein
MNNVELYTEISTLSPSHKNEVAEFVQFLKTKKKPKNSIKEREFGCAKGLFEMQKDFEEPLEDFKDYM